MVGSVTDEGVFGVCELMLATGISLHWLWPRKKNPVDDGWSSAPTHTIETLRAAWRRNLNLGVRLGEPSSTPAGYLHLIDLDIRKPETAEAAYSRLDEMLPNWRDFPFVISGSGNQLSRHIYFTSACPFRSHKVAHAADFAMVKEMRNGVERDVKKWDWEIELYGTGKQAVLPPSIHPNSGLPYTWGRPLDLDMIGLGVGPDIPAAVVETWGAWAPTETDAGEEDLLSFARAQPLDLDESQIQSTVYGLPDDWVHDRDGWIRVGMALAHQYQGGQKGFRLWDEWSQQSPKYDHEDLVRVWKSFDGSQNPVTFASLIQAAKMAAFERTAGLVEDMPEVEEDLDIDDLLGGPPSEKSVLDEIDEMLGGAPQSNTPGVSGADDRAWRSQLALTADTPPAIKATLHNLELIIRNDPRTKGIVALNEFSQEQVQIAKPGRYTIARPTKPVRQLEGPIWQVHDTVNGDMWSDYRDHALRTVLEAPARQGGYALKVSDRDLKSAIAVVASDNRFHPIRDYLSKTVWDGKERLNSVFIRYLGVEDNEYARAVCRLTFLGGVARAFEPGHKFDFMPVLEGVQGKRKSTFISILAHHWFAELTGPWDDRKALVEKMQGSWVLEIPELAGFGKAEVEDIKALISARSDKVRLAWEKRAAVFPRQCIFIASVNNRNYLKDPTGGRRFWPLYCTVQTIDTASFALEIDQVWAEAYAAYKAMRKAQPFGDLPLYLSDDIAHQQALALQEDRRAETTEDVLAGQIGAWLDTPINDDGMDDGAKPVLRNLTSLAEIRVEMFGKDRASVDPRETALYGRAMSMLPNWRRIGVRDRKGPYGKQKTYERIPDQE